MKAAINHTARMLEYRRWKRAQEAAAEKVEVPPVLVPATPTDPNEPWMPKAVRTAYNQALAAGHKVRITRAVGPWLDANGEVAHPAERTLCLAIQGPRGQRAVLHWRWQAGKWKAEDGQDGRTGQIMSITKAKAFIKSWTEA